MKAMTMSLETLIHEKLTAAFQPTTLEVINDSHKHKGHAGSPGTGQSHFTVRIEVAAFEGLSRVACHQLIYKVLDAEFKAGLHALSIKIGSSK